MKPVRWTHGAPHPAGSRVVRYPEKVRPMVQSSTVEIIEPSRDEIAVMISTNWAPDFLAIWIVGEYPAVVDELKSLLAKASARGASRSAGLYAQILEIVHMQRFVESMRPEVQ